MKNFTLAQKTMLVASLGVLLILGMGSQASAYSVTLSFYDGFDIKTETIEKDPTVLVIIVGKAEYIKDVWEIEGLHDPFDFSVQVDVHFEFSPESDNSIVLASEQAVKMAVLDGVSYDDVDESMLGDLDYGSHEISIDMGDTIVLLTADGTYFKIGNIFQNHDFTVSLDYENIELITTPEPSTLLLLVLGGFGIIGLTGRKRQKNNKKCSGLNLLFFIVFLSLFSLIMLSSVKAYAIEVGEIETDPEAPNYLNVSGYKADQLKGLFEEAYDIHHLNEAGEEVLGTPTEFVKEGFTSYTGGQGYTQKFEKGSLESLGQEPEGVFFDIFAVPYPFYEKWETLGLNSKNPLGLPMAKTEIHEKTLEIELPENEEPVFAIKAEFLRFEGGVIAHHLDGPLVDSVYEVHGPIHSKWEDMLFEQSILGFPISDEEDISGGKRSRFEGGNIYWSESAGKAFELHGPILQKYVELGETASKLGFPISNVGIGNFGYDVALFEGGFITKLPGEDYDSYVYANDGVDSLEVYDFERTPDLIYANKKFHAGFPEPNFGASCKIRYNGSGIMAIQSLSMIVSKSWALNHSNGSWLDRFIILREGESHSFEWGTADIDESGDQWVAPKLQIRSGVTYNLDSEPFTVHACDEKSIDKTIFLKDSDGILFQTTSNMGDILKNGIFGFIDSGEKGAFFGLLEEMIWEDYSDPFSQITVNRKHINECCGGDCVFDRRTISGSGDVRLLNHASQSFLGGFFPMFPKFKITADLSYSFEQDITQISQMVCGDATLNMNVDGEFKVDVFGQKVHIWVDSTRKEGQGNLCYNPSNEELCLKNLGGACVTPTMHFEVKLFSLNVEEESSTGPTRCFTDEQFGKGCQ